MRSPIQPLIDALRAAVFDGPGVTSPAARKAAAAHAATRHPIGGFGIGAPDVPMDPAVPEAARAYVDRVGHAATRVTDEGFEALRAELDDDAIFELSIASAVGAGLYRYERALALLSEET